MLLRLIVLCAVATALITAASVSLAPASASEEDASCVKCPACCQFDRLNTQIRDAKTDRIGSQARFRELISLIKENYYARGGADCSEDEWVFPLDGYGPKAIGGRNGSGYRSKGHDYFDGNNYRSHPAHDIFIHDKNRDCLDDRTRKPVMVRSMTNGIIVAEETEWDPTSYLRGGRYIWIYDHLSYLEVHYGSVVARNIYHDLTKRRAERGSGTSCPAHMSAPPLPPRSLQAERDAVSPVTVFSLEDPSTVYANIYW